MSVRYNTVQVGYQKFHIDERYTKLRPIGDGSYGFVASGLDTVTGRKIAIKMVKDVFCDVVDAKRILREIKLLRHLNAHENIIQIYDLMCGPKPNDHNFEDIYIVTNLMESDLERIIKSRQVLTDQHLQYFLYQMLRGLKYVHSANILHRDLKPSNLLVNANCDLALCDFGLARGFDLDGADVLTEYVVTRWYRAPELLFVCPNYGKPVDMWSVGCIFAEVITHEPFFRGDNPQHQLEVIVSKLGCPSHSQLNFITNTAAVNNILKYEKRVPPHFASFFPAGTNPQALDLLTKLLAFNPDERITVDNALAHPYLKDFHGHMSEPVASSIFDFDFERTNMTEKEVRRQMFDEVLAFRPNEGSLPSSGADAKGSESKSSSSAGDKKSVPAGSK